MDPQEHLLIIDAVMAWEAEGCHEIVELIGDVYQASRSKVVAIEYMRMDLDYLEPHSFIPEERKRPELGLNYCNRKRGR